MDDMEISLLLGWLFTFVSLPLRMCLTATSRFQQDTSEGVLYYSDVDEFVATLPDHLL